MGIGIYCCVSLWFRFIDFSFVTFRVGCASSRHEQRAGTVAIGSLVFISGVERTPHKPHTSKSPKEKYPPCFGSTLPPTKTINHYIYRTITQGSLEDDFGFLHSRSLIRYKNNHTSTASSERKIHRRRFLKRDFPKRNAPSFSQQ